MRAKFIGDPNDDFSGPKVVRVKGEAFLKDQFVSVSDKLATTLAGHNHFVIEEGDAPSFQDAAPEPVSRAARAMDGGDDGKAGGSLDKAATLARLQALKDQGAELEFDPKWGLPKLRGLLEAAEFEHGDD